MIEQLNDTFLIKHGKLFNAQTIKKTTLIPFKDHPDLPLIIDILSRKNTHHVMLKIEFSTQFHIFFLEALFESLIHEHIPYPLRDAQCIYLNSKKLHSSDVTSEVIEKDFQFLRTILDEEDHYLLIALSHADFLSYIFCNQFTSLLLHPRCRLIVLTQAAFDKHNAFANDFSCVSLPQIKESDITIILQRQRSELENFHSVLIPEELLSQTYSLAERYLSANDPLSKALLLLDSSAAHASTHPLEEKNENTSLKPVLTTTTLLKVLSSWTHIPQTHLHINAFKLREFSHHLKQKIFGQEAAILLLEHVFQQSYANLQYRTGPFCSVLFAGPKHVGKRTTALILADQLFKQLNVLHLAPITAQTSDALLEIKLHRYMDMQYISLKQLIEHMPYAIILFENVDQASPNLLNQLNELLSTGLLHDEHGIAHDFHQAIIILSITLHSQYLSKLNIYSSEEKETDSADLIRLITREREEVHQTSMNHSPQEIADGVLSEITTLLPKSLCQQLHVIPFLPLDEFSVENIIRLKLKQLEKILDTRHGIELGYASEIIRYLAKNTTHQKIELDQALKQLYFTIEQAVLNQAEHKGQYKQLFLQLNETGHTLRYDWLVSAMRHHTP